MNMLELKDKVTTSMYESYSLSEWRKILAKECGVYVYNEAYVAKRFDHIEYVFVGKDIAKEILVDNLYALLRFKYFLTHTDNIDKRINDIIQSFTANLKTSLLRVSFEWESNNSHKIIKLIPNNCIAFRNGVYDFLNSKWLFKFEVTVMADYSNIIYNYDDSYVITWFIDINFQPLDFSLTNTSLEEFVDIMKDFTKLSKNYCFELMYNMCHDNTHKFSQKRLLHLCEILGYTLLQQFTQHFVLLIGSGQNGKNSLFDGCFTPFVSPKPAANDMESIENDRFITGSLENKYHNIFLETSPKTYTQSTMLKALTGSMYQTVESKNVNKYSAVLNCKYLFAGNEQEKIKFTDTSPGFRRRINIFEVWYRWDKNKDYLKQGDYYEMSFSNDLREFKSDVTNAIIYIYFGMFGLYSATNGFTKDFTFTHNEWKQSFSDINSALKSQICALTLSEISKYIKLSIDNYNECKALFYSEDGKRLHRSVQYYDVYQNSSYDEMVQNLNNSNFVRVVDNNTIYINISILKKILNNAQSGISFTQEIKRIFNIVELRSFYNNQSYLECTLNGDKIMPIMHK